MTSEAIEARAATSALRTAAGRTAALLRRVPDASAAVPGLEWSVAETAAHLVAELTHYAGFVKGTRDVHATLAQGRPEEPPARRTATANAAQLAEFTERDLSRLADMMVPAADDFIAAASLLSGDARILTSNGLFMTIPTMTAALLGEQLIHGLDIARAGRMAWRIPRADALQVIAGIVAMVPDYVDRQRASGLHIVYELRFRGGPRYGLRIDDGTAVITAPSGRVDCWISADPVAFLMIGYGRTAQLSQILRGRMLAGGRKPWLGVTFGRLVTGA
jgi:uncharacterized protein (TIGR03083 family)